MISFFRSNIAADQSQFSKLALGILLGMMVLLNGACRQSNHSPSTAPSAQAQAQKSDQADTTKVHSEIGFANRQKLSDHFDKHGQEFGSISKAQYLDQAQRLRDAPVGGDTLQVVRADGVVTRFDKKTGAFLAFNSDLTIRTYFKPNDGENYFRRQSNRPAGRGNE